MNMDNLYNDCFKTYYIDENETSFNNIEIHVKYFEKHRKDYE